MPAYKIIYLYHNGIKECLIIISCEICAYKLPDQFQFNFHRFQIRLPGRLGCPDQSTSQPDSQLELIVESLIIKEISTN